MWHISNICRIRIRDRFPLAYRTHRGKFGATVSEEIGALVQDNLDGDRERAAVPLTIVFNHPVKSNFFGRSFWSTRTLNIFLWNYSWKLLPNCSGDGLLKFYFVRPLGLTLLTLTITRVNSSCRVLPGLVQVRRFVIIIILLFYRVLKYWFSRKLGLLLFSLELKKLWTCNFQNRKIQVCSHWGFLYVLAIDVKHSLKQKCFSSTRFYWKSQIYCW